MATQEIDTEHTSQQNANKLTEYSTGSVTHPIISVNSTDSKDVTIVYSVFVHSCGVGGLDEGGSIIVPEYRDHYSGSVLCCSGGKAKITPSNNQLKHFNSYMYICTCNYCMIKEFSKILTLLRMHAK